MASNNKQKLTLFYHIVLVLIGSISFFAVIMQISHGAFHITFDQGRDFIWVWNQIFFKRPSLIGPWGSLNGIYFGPFWFWLLAIPALLFSGSPVAMTITNALVVFGAIIALYLLVKKYDLMTAFLWALFCFASPAVRNAATFAFPQHLLLPLTVLFLYALTQFIQESKMRYFWLALFMLSLF